MVFFLNINSFKLGQLHFIQNQQESVASSGETPQNTHMHTHTVSHYESIILL